MGELDDLEEIDLGPGRDDRMGARHLRAVRKNWRKTGKNGRARWQHQLDAEKCWDARKAKDTSQSNGS